MKTLILGSVVFFLFLPNTVVSGTKMVIDTDLLDGNNNFIIEESEEALLKQGKWSWKVYYKILNY